MNKYKIDVVSGGSFRIYEIMADDYHCDDNGMIEFMDENDQVVFIISLKTLMSIQVYYL